MQVQTFLTPKVPKTFKILTSYIVLRLKKVFRSFPRLLRQAIPWIPHKLKLKAYLLKLRLKVRRQLRLVVKIQLMQQPSPNSSTPKHSVANYAPSAFLQTRISKCILNLDTKSTTFRVLNDQENTIANSRCDIIFEIIIRKKITQWHVQLAIWNLIIRQNFESTSKNEHQM